MNRFINNTIQKVSSVNGQRKKIFSGKVSRYDGNTIECSGFPATIGTLCKVLTDVLYFFAICESVSPLFIL